MTDMGKMLSQAEAQAQDLERSIGAARELEALLRLRQETADRARSNRVATWAGRQLRKGRLSPHDLADQVFKVLQEARMDERS